MKNKKGFTLIELLAIIVILAIIAVITVPIILNIIENSKMGAASDSAYGFKDAVNKSYLTILSEDLDYEIPDNTYTVEELKTQIDLSLSGKEPASNSWVTIEENDVKEGCLQFDEFKVELSDGKVTKTEKGNCDGYVIGSSNEEVKPLEIGDSVDYSTSLNGVTLNKWKVFYIEGDYTYLIYASNSLPNNAIDGNSLSNISVESNCYFFATDNRLSLVNAMTTKSNWNSLLTGTLNGTIAISESTTENVWAMGSPTAELWVASWNASYPDDVLYLAQTVTNMADGVKGYYVGNTPNPNTVSTSLSAFDGYNNTLYFPSKSDSDYGYWLASYSADNQYNVMSIRRNGYFDNKTSTYGYAHRSFRPVIRFLSSVINK